MNSETIGRFVGKRGDLIVFAVLAALCVLTVAVLGKDVKREVSEVIKVWLALGAMFLALRWTCIPRKIAVVLLSVLVFVSAANYMRWGPEQLTERADAYDLIHYYLGAKYFDELGYYDLYPALALADHEAGAYSSKLKYYRAQEPGTGYEERPIVDAIERGREIREREFTPARWQTFSVDFLRLQREFKMGKRLWRILINDRGFNATPAWIMLFSPVAKIVPVEYIKILCLMDVIFLAVGLLFIRWAYGNITVLWGLAFIFISYSFRWPVIGWAFFRYDWVCALLVALALIKKNHYFSAGVMTAFAGLSRLFPVIWLFGPAAKGLVNLVYSRDSSSRWNRKLLLLAAGFLITVAVVGSGALLKLGPGTFRAHAINISEHVKPEELSSKRLGYVIGMFYDGKLEPKTLSYERKQLIKKYKPIHLIIAFGMLGIMAWFMKNRPNDEIFAYGFIPFFLLLTASYYYYSVRILLIIYHAANIDHARHRNALAILLALEAFSNWVETSFDDHRAFLIGYLAWGLTVYAIYIIWGLYKDRMETRRAAK